MQGLILGQPPSQPPHSPESPGNPGAWAPAPRSHPWSPPWDAEKGPCGPRGTGNGRYFCQNPKPLPPLSTDNETERFLVLFREHGLPLVTPERLPRTAL